MCKDSQIQIVDVRVTISESSRKSNKVLEKKGVEMGGGGVVCGVRINPVVCPGKLGLFVRRNMG